MPAIFEGEALMRTGRTIANRYRLEQPLASGGMGTVWIAEHIQLGIQVAVKFMDPELTSEPDLRSRFEREAKSAAALSSPHVIKIHDYGVDGEVPFIAMELLRGEDLEMRLARAGGPLPSDEVVKIVIQTCKALRAAHDEGIVHRDLKPSNIFITKDGDDELLKVLDFGIAKETGFNALGMRSSHDTSARELLGSPAYISPEQIRRARTVDRRTDLWSLAVIAYEACTGLLPFDSEDTGDILAKILTESAEPASRANPNLPPELDAFFERALLRDVDARFQSAREFAKEFMIACGGKRSSSGTSGAWDSVDASGGLQALSAQQADDEVRIQVEKVQAHTVVMSDPETFDPAIPTRRAPAEAFRTDANRAVEIAPASSAPSAKAPWVWLAVALLGLGVVAVLVTGNLGAEAPTNAAPDSSPQAEPVDEPSSSTPASEELGAAPSAPVTAEPSAPATSAKPATTPSSDGSAAPPKPAPAYRPRQSPKPKSDVLGF